MVQKRAPGGGRKPKGQFKGKSAAFSTRITPELREALDAESKRTGRSISQIVEQRLRDSFDRAKWREAAGADHIRALAYCVARLAIQVEQATGERWHENIFAYEVLTTAIGEMMFHSFRPGGELVVPDSVKAMERKSSAGERRWSLSDPTDFAFMLAWQFSQALSLFRSTAGRHLDEMIFRELYAEELADAEPFLSESDVLKFVVKNTTRRPKP